MKNINKKKRIKTKAGFQSCKLEQSDRDGLILVSHYQVQEDTRFSHQVLKNAERNIPFPNCQVQEKTHTIYTMISGRVTPFSCFALSTTRACTVHSRFPLITYQRMQKDKKSHREIPFLALQSEKLQVVKGRAQVVEILQSCCDWCCYLSSNQTSSCAKHSILKFGQIHA